MDRIKLPYYINKYKVYSGSLNSNMKFFLEVSEEMSGGSVNKLVLNKHVDKILTYADLSERFNLKITQRPVENGDQFIFLCLTNYTEMNHTVKFSIVLTNTSSNNIYDLNKYYKEPEKSNRYGINKLTTPSKYIHTDIGSVLMSKNIIYTDNNLYYENMAKSITRKLYEESDDLKVYVKGNSVHIETIVRLLPGKKSDMFLMISENQLFSSKENMNSFFEDYSLSIQNNDVRFNMWITPQGSYTKLPYSIEPFDRDAYGINLHHMSKKEMVRYYNITKDRFFFNMIYNAIIQLFGYRPEIKGLFLTDYTSTWLKKDYNISAPYIDTRLNETVTLTIKDVEHMFSFPQLSSYHLTYANFLVEYSRIGKLININDQAYFFPDYFSLDETAQITHSSLNHQLGILHYILSKFKITNNKDYEEVSQALLLAIQYTQNNWIKEDGDLYYKIFIKEDRLCFDEPDYIYVTLLDLLLVQEILLDIYNNRNSAIDKLIISKINYLAQNGYGLNDENALLPANEDITSRETAKKLAKKLNYIE